MYKQPTFTIRCRLVIAICLALSGCQQSATPTSADTACSKDRQGFWAGTLTQQGVTSHMYGTHRLSGWALDGSPLTATRQKPYAVSSDTLDLDRWIGDPVVITGELVPGYPVDGGPPYIRALCIEWDQAMGRSEERKSRPSTHP